MSKQTTLFPGNTILSPTFAHQGRFTSGVLADMFKITADELTAGQIGLPMRVVEALRLPTVNVPVNTVATTSGAFFILTGSGISLDLPSPATCDGQIFGIKNDVGQGGNTITADGGSVNIDGVTNYLLTSALDSIFVMADATQSMYYVIASNAAASIPSGVPQWVSSASIPFGAFSAFASFIGQVSIVPDLPAGGVISSGRIKTSAAFSGPGITSVQAAIGIAVAGSFEEIVPFFDVSTFGDDLFSITNIVDSFNNSSATTLLLTLKTTGAFVNALTAGALTPSWLQSIIST